MSLTKKFSERYFMEKEMENCVNSGANEAEIARKEFRRKRLERDVCKELNALRLLNGAFSGAVVRKNWRKWKMILEHVKEEIYE